MNTATPVTIAVLTALTPTVTCLIGIILSRQDVRDLRVELRGQMAELRKELQGDMAALRADMVAMRKEVHADLLLIHERVAIVEGRQGR